VHYFKNLWFLIRAKRKPKLTDTKTQKKMDLKNELNQKLVASVVSKKYPDLKQIKYIGKLLNPREKFLIKIFSGIIILSLLFIVINSYLNFSTMTPDYGGEYTEGLVGSPQYINPILAQTNDVDIDISSLIYNGLITYDPNNGLVADLAESYSISEDQKIYTFVLRDDISWHDGHKLTADDILFTFERIKDPNSRSPLYFNFKGTTLEKIDDTTIRFILEEPFSPFLESLTTGILPEHIWKNVPIQNTNLTDLNLKPIGTGPYKFDSLIKDNRTGEIKSYALINNKDYFKGRPYIKKITFKFYPSFDQAIEALNNKNVQAISFLPTEKQDRIINNRSLNFYTLNLPQYTALFINQNKNALLKDTTLRKILAHGINKDAIVTDILQNKAKKIDSPILHGQISNTNEYPKYPFDLDHAKAELEKLNWKLSSYEQTESKEVYPFQVRKKNDTYLELTLTTVNQPENVKIAELIQKDWQLLGIKTNLQFVEPDNIQKDTLKNRNYEILLYGEIIGYDPDPYPFWHSSQSNHPGLNLSLFSNNKADELLEQARKTTKPEERAEKYIEFQKILAEEVPAIFLFNPTYTYPQTRKIRGFNNYTIILPANRLANIHEWFIKTDREFK